VKKLLHSKWTSVDKCNGWIHYQVRNVLINKKQVELYAVCKKSVSLITNVKDLRNKSRWLPGWKDL
tara:strand:- start:1567 stop:1764 length:198 start_codon:yes stop_codon:yes gene_type:complete